jgi:hypothetical protein
LVSYYIGFLNQLLLKSIIGWLFIAYVVDDNRYPMYILVPLGNNMKSFFSALGY